MSGPRWIVSQVHTAFEVPRWAFGFYLRHLLLVVGVSLVPAAQRVVWALWRERLPVEMNAALEMVTTAARLLLIILVARLAFAGPQAAYGTSAERRGVWAFLFARWPSMIIQLLLIGALAVVFDFIPERIIAPQVPPDLRREYWAALLALKNPTIVAFTIIWLIGAVRQATLYPKPLTLSLATRPPKADAPRAEARLLPGDTAESVAPATGGSAPPRGRQ